MIIPSLLDTDLYKFTMMQVVQHQFAEAQVEYRFKCRNPGVDLTPYVAEIEDEIRALTTLRFTQPELDYLRHWRFFKSDFRRPAGPVPAGPAFHLRHAAPGLAARDRHHDQGTVAAHDPVRGAGAGDRVRGVLPEHGARAGLRRGPPAPAREDRAGERRAGSDFRIADYGTRRRSRAAGTTR